MTARELENAIHETTLDCVRIRELALMANAGQDEGTDTALHLIHEMAKRANERFCELALKVGKLGQPAPGVADKPKRRAKRKAVRS